MYNLFIGLAMLLTAGVTGYFIGVYVEPFALAMLLSVAMGVLNGILWGQLVDFDL